VPAPVHAADEHSALHAAGGSGVQLNPPAGLSSLQSPEQLAGSATQVPSRESQVPSQSGCSRRHRRSVRSRSRDRRCMPRWARHPAARGQISKSMRPHAPSATAPSTTTDPSPARIASMLTR
jgi:hypothetical protein